eukprot:gb/GECH01007355.1/.p1 GENE.gb/GECH01007355.1/~~gb/GECH01007355.1/.p1  ORF type:complete len:209 (+),score=41.03 gb/GECH01007355.1/:1-627(+)
MFSLRKYLLVLTTFTLLVGFLTGFTEASLDKYTTPSNSTTHLMHHEASSKIVTLLDSIAERITNDVQNRKGSLREEKQSLKEKISKHEGNIAEHQETIDKTTSKAEDHRDQLDQIKKEISEHEERWDDYEDKKDRFRTHLNLVKKIRNLITGFMSLNGEECSEDRRCHDHLECDVDNICRLPIGATCSRHSECLIGVDCNSGVCVSSI